MHSISYLDDSLQISRVVLTGGSARIGVGKPRKDRCHTACSQGASQESGEPKVRSLRSGEQIAGRPQGRASRPVSTTRAARPYLCSRRVYSKLASTPHHLNVTKNERDCLFLDGQRLRLIHTHNYWDFQPRDCMNFSSNRDHWHSAKDQKDRCWNARD